MGFHVHALSPPAELPISLCALLAFLNWLLMHFVVAQRPSYPSSKPGKKDWDSLEAQVKKEVCLVTFEEGCPKGLLIQHFSSLLRVKIHQ